MKKTIAAVLSLGLMFLSVSCKKANGPEPTSEQNTGDPTDYVTSVGTPEGEMITVSIGPAGGSIESDDKRIRVEIPAGALTANQTISLQPITNNCPGGQGQAFRLLPHGLKFAKPATITFQYTESDLEGTFPDVLTIAYQDDKSVWRVTPNNILDASAKQLSVQTTHFSDWSFFKRLYLDPTTSYIDPGDDVTLTLKQHVISKPFDNEGLVVPPVPIIADNNFIKKWTLNGYGALIQAGNSRVTYISPNSIPAINPAVVSADLSVPVDIEGKTFKDVRVLANIYVAPVGLTYRINGGEWVNTVSPLGASAVDTQRGRFITFSTVAKDARKFGNVTLTWKENLGVVENDMPWELEKNNVNAPLFNLTEDPTGEPMYVHFYEQNKVAYASPGNLAVQREYNEKGKTSYFLGKFYLEKAGIMKYNPNGSPFRGTAKIEGFFRIKLER